MTAPPATPPPITAPLGPEEGGEVGDTGLEGFGPTPGIIVGEVGRYCSTHFLSLML
jgi:hypothetical protein